MQPRLGLVPTQKLAGDSLLLPHRTRCHPGGCQEPRPPSNPQIALLHRAGSTVPIPVPAPIAPSQAPLPGTHRWLEAASRAGAATIAIHSLLKIALPAEGPTVWLPAHPKSSFQTLIPAPHPEVPPQSARTWVGGCRHGGADSPRWHRALPPVRDPQGAGERRRRAGKRRQRGSVCFPPPPPCHSGS